MKIENILKLTREYLPKEDENLINKAYSVAEKAHKNQLRGTGEPYIEHPLEVAYVLTKDHLDANTISAALLHDVEEDNPKLFNEIKSYFDPEIIQLVEGVTKLGKIKIKKSWFFPLKYLQDKKEEEMLFERHVESLRKMFMAMSKDIRIILIKLADRLHNMKTLIGVNPIKRERIAQETLEIYTPLAQRLGMGRIKGELEDLAFPYAYPKEFANLKKMVGPKYEKKEKYISKIKYILKEQFKQNGINVVEIDGRKKHFYSLFRKLRKYDNDLSKIYDLVALRIILSTTEDCYKALGTIHSMWKPLIGRIKDYIALPKPNGYQSLHTTVFGPEGEIFEIQIRTKEMHEKAEFGIAAHWHYSEQKKSARYVDRKISFTDKNELEWLNELAEWQKKAQDKKEWEKGVKMDFFEDRIFAFTPLGDVINLPQGATPVDFAYAVHTDVGDKCAGAKVNGKIVSLNYNLKNGEIVDIITGKNSSPKRDWLNFTKTSRARGKIKNKL
jgi:GTP pyrophosphokinase